MTLTKAGQILDKDCMILEECSKIYVSEIIFMILGMIFVIRRQIIGQISTTHSNCLYIDSREWNKQAELIWNTFVTFLFQALNWLYFVCVRATNLWKECSIQIADWIQSNSLYSIWLELCVLLGFTWNMSFSLE